MPPHSAFCQAPGEETGQPLFIQHERGAGAVSQLLGKTRYNGLLNPFLFPGGLHGKQSVVGMAIQFRTESATFAS